MEVPNVKRKDYQLIGMDDDFLSLMDDSGETRDDLKCPSEDSDVGKEVKNSIADETDICHSTATPHGRLTADPYDGFDDGVDMSGGHSGLLKSLAPHIVATGRFT